MKVRLAFNCYLGDPLGVRGGCVCLLFACWIGLENEWRDGGLAGGGVEGKYDGMTMIR